MEKNQSCVSSDESFPQNEGSMSVLASCACFSPSSFLSHVFTTGTAIVSAGVISGVFCSILVLKSQSKLHNHDEEGSYERGHPKEGDRQSSEYNIFLFQQSSILPLEGLGLDYGRHRFLSALGSGLKKAAPLMIYIADSTMSEGLLTAIVCLPIALFYFIWITLTRNAPQVIVLSHYTLES